MSKGQSSDVSWISTTLVPCLARCPRRVASAHSSSPSSPTARAWTLRRRQPCRHLAKTPRKHSTQTINKNKQKINKRSERGCLWHGHTHGAKNTVKSDAKNRIATPPPGGRLFKIVDTLRQHKEKERSAYGLRDAARWQIIQNSRYPERTQRNRTDMHANSVPPPMTATDASADTPASE
jgi:hypothetical protein